MAAIYPPNQTPMRIGDLVIHDADAKRADMLRIVIGCSQDRIYRTRYAFPPECGHGIREPEFAHRDGPGVLNFSVDLWG